MGIFKRDDLVNTIVNYALQAVKNTPLDVDYASDTDSTYLQTTEAAFRLYQSVEFHGYFPELILKVKRVDGIYKAALAPVWTTAVNLEVKHNITEWQLSTTNTFSNGPNTYSFITRHPDDLLEIDIPQSFLLTNPTSTIYLRARIASGNISSDWSNTATLPPIQAITDPSNAIVRNNLIPYDVYLRFRYVIGGIEGEYYITDISGAELTDSSFSSDRISHVEIAVEKPGEGILFSRKTTGGNVLIRTPKEIDKEGQYRIWYRVWSGKHKTIWRYNNIYVDRVQPTVVTKMYNRWGKAYGVITEVFDSIVFGAGRAIRDLDGSVYSEENKMFIHPVYETENDYFMANNGLPAGATWGGSFVASHHPTAPHTDIKKGVIYDTPNLDVSGANFTTPTRRRFRKFNLQDNAAGNVIYQSRNYTNFSVRRTYVQSCYIGTRNMESNPTYQNAAAFPNSDGSIYASNFIFVCGGLYRPNNSNDVYPARMAKLIRRNLANNGWDTIPLPGMPRYLWHHSVTDVGIGALVTGGYYWPYDPAVTPPVYGEDDEDTVRMSNRTYLWRPNKSGADYWTGHWYRMADLPFPISSHCMEHLRDDTVLIIGGQITEHNKYLEGKYSSPIIFEFNYVTGEYNIIGYLPEPLYAAASVKDQLGRIWIFGGEGLRARPGSYTNVQPIRNGLRLIY